MGGDEVVTITPKDWGPFMWHTLYVIAIAMPATPSDDERAGFVDLIEGLKRVVPCGLCRAHFTEYIGKHRVSRAARSRDGMLKWVLGAENAVRARQDKPLRTLDDIQSLLVGNHSRLQGNSDSGNSGGCSGGLSPTAMAMSVLAVLVLGYIMYSKRP